MKLIISEQAVGDLVRLRAHIAEQNPTAAARIATDLRRRIARLRRFPEMGREVHGVPPVPGVRDLVAASYVIRYLVRPDILIILRIWHVFEDRPDAASGA